MKRLIAMIFVLACSACAPVTMKINASDAGRADSVSMVDMRPATEKAHKFFSLLITSKEYGVMRVGDAKLVPHPINLLQYQVYEKFNGTGPLPKVTVYHFVIYLNADVQLRAGARRAYGGGLLSNLMIDKAVEYSTPGQSGLVNSRAFDDLSNDEYQRGLYSASEDASGAAVYIVYIDTEIDGRRVFTRTMSPIGKQAGKEALANAVQLAITNQLAHYGAPVQSPSAASSAGTGVGPASAPSGPASVGVAGSTASTGSAAMPMAQAAANQMGCGVVKSTGDSTFTAPCGSYSVLIGCDGSQCRPLHTIRDKSGE